MIETTANTILLKNPWNSWFPWISQNEFTQGTLTIPTVFSFSKNILTLEGRAGSWWSIIWYRPQQKWRWILKKGPYLKIVTFYKPSFWVSMKKGFKGCIWNDPRTPPSQVVSRIWDWCPQEWIDMVGKYTNSTSALTLFSLNYCPWTV